MKILVIENAIRHTPGRALIDVRLERHRNGRCLLVSGNSQGIPANERARVLRRFYRLDRSRSTTGSGLGLSLVSAMAKLHQASLVLENNDPGLRVRIDFPADRHA